MLCYAAWINILCMYNCSSVLRFCWLMPPCSAMQCSALLTGTRVMQLLEGVAEDGRRLLGWACLRRASLLTASAAGSATWRSS